MRAALRPAGGNLHDLACALGAALRSCARLALALLVALAALRIADPPLIQELRVRVFDYSRCCGRAR